MKNQPLKTPSFFAALLSLICLAAFSLRADAGPLFNRERMLLVDGQPRFILGLYENPKDDAVLKEAVEAGFNLIQCGGSVEALDRIDRAGAKAWVNLGDALDLSRDTRNRTERLAEMVQRVGHHPALLVWEGPDEILWNNWWVTMEKIRPELETMRKMADGRAELAALQRRARDMFERGLYVDFEKARAEFWSKAGQPSPNPGVRMDDVPERVAQSGDGITAGIRAVREMDSHHAIWLNHAPRNSLDDLRLYNRAADMVGCDIYPAPANLMVGHSDLLDMTLGSVGAYTERMRAAAPGKACAMVLQGFGWRELNERPNEKEVAVGVGRRPSFGESRFMAYDAIIHGANAILYWGTAYMKPVEDDGTTVTGRPRLWRDLLRLARELRALEPALLAPPMESAKVRQSPTYGSIDGAGIVCSLRQVDDDYILLVVNEAGDGLAFSIENLPAKLDGRTLHRLYSSEEHVIDRGALRDGIRSRDVHVYATSRRFESAMSTLGAKPRLILNEDDSHFFGTRSADEMNIESLRAFVDQYADTAVTHLFLCPNAMKSSYRSQVRDAIWEFEDGQKRPEDEFARKWCGNARLLDERGLDPYAIWIARCREKKISPWLSMRMNDVHNANDVDNYIHSSFWRKHPEYWRVPGGGGWTDRALDYGIPAVREHAMAYVRDLLERYDPDGLELDWMRFGYHFRPGKEAEGVNLLTQFMRDVRGLTREWSKKRGHPIQLGARVPTLPEAARGLGMDGVTWVREGLVDMLVPTPFWATTDFDIPVERWREQIGEAGRGVMLAPGAEILVRAYPAAQPIEADITSTRGFSASNWHRGADAIYLFNYMDPAPMTGGKAAYRTLLEEGLDLKAVSQKLRRHVVTYRDTVAPGMSNDVGLPLDGIKGGTFRIHIGPKPKMADAFVVVGLGSADAAVRSRFDVTVNGQACSSAVDLDSLSLLPGVVQAGRFACPADFLRDGYNDVQIRQLPGEPEQKVVWVELRIQPTQTGSLN
ncbi:MAG: hypothetical protein AB9869_33510 [Verrucomicrobiia bacterium]